MKRIFSGIKEWSRDIYKLCTGPFSLSSIAIYTWLLFAITIGIALS